MAAVVRQDVQDLQDCLCTARMEQVSRVAVFHPVNYVNPVQVSGEEVGAR